MEPVKYLFNNAPKSYKKYLNDSGVFNWNDYTINISIKRIGLDKYVSYDTIEHLISIFSLNCPIPCMNDLNLLFIQYNKELYETYILHCPFIHKDKRYMEFYCLDSILKKFNTNTCRSFYRHHIKCSIDFIDLFKSNFPNELINIQKTHVIINKDVYNKIGQDNRAMHNKNANLLRENNDLTKEIIRLQNIIKLNKCLECISNQSDVSTDSMTDSE